MTLRELFDAGYALYGMHWQRALGRALGVNERTVRWWLQRDDGSRLPANLAERLNAIFEARIHELQSARAKLKIRDAA